VQKSITVSEAKPKLGKLLDKMRDGHPIYLRRKERLFRIERVDEIEAVPSRPFGCFAIEKDDPTIALANSDPSSFTHSK